MRLGLIGGGPLGEGIAAAALNKGGVTPGAILGSDVGPHPRGPRARRPALPVGADTPRVPAEADIALLAVKPQEFGSVAKILQGHLNSRQTVISIMAGGRIEGTGSHLQH